MKTENFFLIKFNASKILIATAFLLSTISIVQLYIEIKQLKTGILIQSRLQSEIDNLESRIDDLESRIDDLEG